MATDLQRAGLWKRMAAGIFDSILTGIAAVGLALLLSLILGYDTYSATLETGYAEFEAQYGVNFQISQEDYLALSQAERDNYDAAYGAMMADEEILYAYNMTVNLMMVITTTGILTAMLALEFFVPLLIGNGQTLGKKIFSICLMRTDGVAMNRMQLFARTILGKFTLETMVPISIVFMIFWGILDVTGTLVLLGLGIAQLVIMTATRTNSLIHDLLAGTVVVDYASQMIFRTTEDLIDYQKNIAAERAARQKY